MSDGPTIGDWTQYEWIPDDASSFPARIRLRDAAWMVYYEPDISDIKAENAKLRELGGEVASILFNLDVDHCGLCQRDSISHPCPVHTVKGGECLIKSELRELGIEVN